MFSFCFFVVVISALNCECFANVQGKIYTREELQSMLMEMVRDFESPQLFCGASIFDNSRSMKRGRWETNSMVDRGSRLHVYGTSS